MYPDGTLQTQLAGTADLDKDPAMAPDGTSVVLSGMRGTATDEIWKIDLTSGAAQRLTVDTFADRSPDWQGLVLQTNHPPLAGAGPDMNVPCAGADGALVSLNGSGSSDPDDNLAIYEWFASFGTPGQQLLGTGMEIQVLLPPGTTDVTLRVTDTDGLQATDSMTVIVVDPQPASLSVTADPNVLWPPNHQMVDVHVSVQATGGLCSPTPQFELQSVQNSQADSGGNGKGHRGVQSQGNEDVAGADLHTPDLDLQLRAERDGGDPAGRVYTLTYVITTGTGAGTTTSTQVIVPHDVGFESDMVVGKSAGQREPSDLKRRMR